WDTDEALRPRLVTDETGREEYDGTEKPDNLVTWVYDGTSFTPVAKVTGGERYTIVHDYLGTPTQAYDSKGELVWEMLLDVYGKVKECHGDRTLVPFRYQGQYEDGETGLYYNRFRYYSPGMGMYISSDPIGLAGNNPTLYGYVEDVNIWLDSWGLTKYVVYQAPELDSVGNPTGNIYTGRTRGSDEMSTQQILNKRKSNHHRNLGELVPVFETNSYEAVRGGEHYYITETRKSGKAADQINGIANRNFGKNGKKLKGDIYMDAFYSENPSLRPNSCN
ncbi:RHS repeat-associated core domain-containing protein, partial [Bacteroides fragilis]